MSLERIGVVCGDGRINRVLRKTFGKPYEAIDDVEKGKMKDDKSGGGEV